MQKQGDFVMVLAIHLLSDVQRPQLIFQCLQPISKILVQHAQAGQTDCYIWMSTTEFLCSDMQALMVQVFGLC